jgi:hypothetical protein
MFLPPRRICPVMRQVVHAVEAAQQRRLAAAGRPDERGDALLRDLEADAFERVLLAVVQIELVHLEGDGLVFHLDSAHRAIHRLHINSTAEGGLALHACHVGGFHFGVHAAQASSAR